MTKRDNRMMPVTICDVPIQCINQAAVAYHIPATLIITVLKKENGRIGMINKNKNGSYDIGPMQINSQWLSQIAPYGFHSNDILFDPCKNVEVGAWILSTEIATAPDWKTGVGNYHSHHAKFNQPYRVAVLDKMRKLEQIIYSNERR